MRDGLDRRITLAALRAPKLPSPFPPRLQVQIGVHNFMEHSTDSEFVVGEGVERDVMFDPPGPVARPQVVPRFAGFGVVHEFPDAEFECGKVAIGLGFVPLAE